MVLYHTFVAGNSARGAPVWQAGNAAPWSALARRVPVLGVACFLDPFLTFMFREVAMMAFDSRHRFGIATVLGAVVCVGTAVAGATDAASLPEDAHWIWSPAHRSGHVPEAQCFFRKAFSLDDPVHGEIFITCDDTYALYVNGRHVGSGHAWRTLDHYDITPHLVRGRNLVAVKAANKEPGSAGLLARVVLKQEGQAHLTYPTGTDWKTSLKGASDWNALTHADLQWLPAQSIGRLGPTLPWGNQVRMAGEHGRFRAPPEFQVEWVLGAEATGSLNAMTFNGRGQIVAAREGGPLLLVSDKDQDGVHETITTYCDQVSHCQGLLAIDGELLAVGDGPQGAALYRLSDSNGDTKVDAVRAIVRFRDAMGEHGPHAVRLGPDGLIYIVLGNFAQVDGSYAAGSPYHHYYEGDLVQPRYEDPSGHAAGVKAPGGTIVRTDADGSFIELVAGGLRNAYDIAFNARGDLFAYDAEMAWDLGTPWYRPTRINHVTPGAELGWRSGWSKWPEHYIDTLPAALSMGPGWPTGVESYDHVTYPVRYHGALFACDWVRGRIHVVHLSSSGSSYRAKAEVFVEGRPLNAMDIAVGPDGYLYFCTGGRGTAGGIYRVVWNGRIPPQATELGKGIQRALRQPQYLSAWARHNLTDIQHRLGDQWDTQLVAIASGAANSPSQRTRALDLMQLLGPPPPPALLRQLSTDKDAQVRAKATYLMGVQGDVQTARRLAELLGDPDPVVRRLACESIVRGRYEASPTRLVGLLADQDRFVAYAARRALEGLPPKAWQARVLGSRSLRAFLQGATGLMVARPSAETAGSVLDRCRRMVRGDVRQPGAPKGFINDQDFTDMLRVIQLALMRGRLTAGDVPQLRAELAGEYPTRDATINRELVRLLVYLEDPSVTTRLIAQLDSKMPMAEKVHLAMHASLIDRGWTSPSKLKLLAFLDRASHSKGGPSLGRYLEAASGQVAAGLTEAERRQVLDGGANWPRAAFAVLAKMPPESNRTLLRQVKTLDQQLLGIDGDDARRLRLAIVAVLGRSRGDEAMAHLRQIYATDPSRREAVAMGLAQNPGGENWPLLVRSLSILDGVAAIEVLGSLAEVNRVPDESEALRQVILCGLRTKAQGAPLAVKLLAKWTGAQVSAKDDPWDVALSKWQAWFAKTHPDQPAAELAKDLQRSKWTYRELLSLLESQVGTAGNSQRGALVFQRAQCASCHRYGNQGTSLGPDLTTVSQRLHQKEILESVLFPSHVVADQYADKIVVTTDGHTFSGIPARAGNDAVVLAQPGRDQVKVAVEQIEQIAPRKGSAMPDGLLDVLTLEQVADLFAFLGKPPRTIVTSRRSGQSSQ